MSTLSAPEMTGFVGGMRVLGHRRAETRPGVFTTRRI
jgi:catalase (peroxidase I)